MPGRLKALEGVVERCLEAPQNWAQPLYYQKVFKTERFRYDSVMVLDSYQFREISRNREEPWPIPPQCPVPYAGRASSNPTRRGSNFLLKSPLCPTSPASQLQRGHLPCRPHCPKPRVPPNDQFGYHLGPFRAEGQKLQILSWELGPLTQSQHAAHHLHHKPFEIASE